MKNIADYVLLYQKDKDSCDFPFVEAKRAVRCFERKPVFARLRPSCVIINPADDQSGLEGRLKEIDLELKFDHRVGQGYLWLSGVI